MRIRGHKSRLVYDTNRDFLINNYAINKRTKNRNTGQAKE